MKTNTRAYSLATAVFLGVLVSLHGEASKPTDGTIVVTRNELNPEDVTFHGLAGYLGRIQYVTGTASGFTPKEPRGQITLSREEHFVALGRIHAVVVVGEGTTIAFDTDQIEIIPPAGAVVPIQPRFLARDQLDTISPGLSNFRYAGLWRPLAILARGIEWLLGWIQGVFVPNWGLAILALALVLRILLLPVSILTLRAQRTVSRFQTLLEPKLADIKANYNGEEAHNRVIAAHKELGITPFFTLRPMLSTLIQIPVLVAVFNVLGEMPQLYTQSFLWIKDLSLPDALAPLPFTLPGLGDTFNLLPFLMSAVSIASTLLFRNRHAPVAEVRRQKRNLYFMTAGFFVLFYPFPAAMVIFWTAANVLQAVQQRFLKS